MIKQKENDLILAMAGNLDLTPTDLLEVGVNSSNTSLQDKEVYLGNKQIQEMDIFKNNDGEFDKQLFSDFYDQAKKNFALMEFIEKDKNRDKLIDEANKDKALHSSDYLWAPNSTTIDQTTGKTVTDFNGKNTFDALNTTHFSRSINPLMNSYSTERLGKVSESPWSAEEIAQKNRVYDPATDTWEDAPNDLWLGGHWSDVLVMAQYDEDTTDPDGTVHKKGSLKLDPVTGRYYYEHLNGRNVYNKRVFNRFNNLTEDGSTLNKFDFFDSDDKGEKSLLGSIAKTSVLVGSLFIPYVGKYLAGLSVANQTLGMIGGLSKLFYGDDNSWGNAMQGWSKQWERTARTEYASDKDNTWCTENILNMATDCFAQLAEQRWLFQAAPKLFGNKDAIKALESTVTAEEKAKGITNYSKTIEDVAKRYQGQVKNIIQKTGKPLSRGQLDQTEMADAVLAYEKAQKYVDNMIKYNQKLGANLSQVWMTGLVTQDAYSEAKAAGATDAEAFTFAVSWAVAEMGILKSGLGEHILPELKLQQAQMRQLQKQAAKQFMENGTLGAVTENVSKQEAKKAFNNIYQKVQNFVKTRNDVWANSYAKNIMSQGLGEGIEEVSEDLTADLIKSGFELKRYLADEEKLDWDPWEDWGTRYLQSFVGGALGGSANGAFTDFKPFKELATAYGYKDDPEKSAAENSAARKKLLTQQMISIVRDKEQYDLFKKALDKADLGLSDVLSNERDENDQFYIANDEHESQNHAAKRAILAQMDYIKNILDSERVNVSPNDVLSSLCREDQDLVLGASLRNRLANSDAALLHLNRHQSLQADFVATCDKVKQLETGNGDQPRKRTETEEEEYQLAKKQKEILKSQLNDFINGKAQPSFIGMALFEMVPGLHENFGNAFSFKDFAKSKYGITDFTKENPNKLKLIEQEYKQLKEVKGPEYLYQSYTMFNNLAQASKDNLNKSLTQFKEAAQQQTQEIKDACTNLKIALNKFHGNFEQNPDEAIAQFIKLYGNKLNAGNIEDLQNAIEANVNDLLDWTEEPINDEESDQLPKNAMTEFFYHLQNKPKSSDDMLKAFQRILQDKKIDQALEDLEVEASITYHDVTPKELAALQNLMHLLATSYLSETPFDGFAQVLKDQLNVNKLTDYLKSHQTKYLNPATKHYLNEFINALPSNVEANRKEFDTIKASINSTPSFDLFNILNNFIQDTTKPDQVENILSVLNDTLLAYRNGLQINLASYSMGDESLEYLKTIISQLKALKSLVYSFSKDSASMANVKGYSPVVNSLYSKIDPAYKALPELDYADAQALQDEIQLFMNYLQAFVKVDDYNSGNKLKEETIYEVNYAINYFREVKTFFNALDDDDKRDFDAYTDLTARLKTADEEAKKPVEEKKNKLEIYNLQGDAKKNFFKEYVKLQSDLHEFLKNLDSEKLQKCFNAYFKREGDSTLLNRVQTDYEADYTSDTLNPAIFINHLMANKALNRAQFEFKYGEIISNHVPNGVADLAVLQGQKQNLYLATALFANRGVINSIATMGNSFLKTFLADKNNHSACKDLFNGAEYKYMEKAPKWFTTLVSAQNMMLIEGLAGTGKSSAVLTLLMEIAKSLNKDTAPMEKVWISNSGVGDDVKNAQGLIDKWDDKKLINKASCQAFNHDLLMKRVYPDYLYNSKDKTLEKPKLVIKSDGTISLDLSSIQKDPNAPSMIIIDEASFYTQADMLILEAYCKVNNILLYSGGDFDQNSMELKIPNEGSGGQPAYAANTRQMFYRGEKITTVLRTDNSLLTEGTRAIQKTINNNNYTANVQIYSGPDGVRGIYTKKDAFETDSREGKLAMNFIVQARDTDPAATFMLIAKDINPSSNPLVKYLKDTLKDKLICYTPETAQGNEADYSIVDATGVDKKELGRYVYTGTSRAKKASFAFNTQTLSVKPAGVMKLKRERLSDSIKLTSVQNELAKIKSLADDGAFDEVKNKAIEIKTEPAFGSDTSGTAGVEVAPAPAPEPSPADDGSAPAPSPDPTPEATPEPAPSTTTTGSEPEGSPAEAPEVEETPPTGAGTSPKYDLAPVAAQLFERAEEWEGYKTQEEAQDPDLNNYKEQYKFNKDSKWVDREDPDSTVTVQGIQGYEHNGQYYTVVIFNDGTSTRALLPKLFTDKYKPEGEEEVQNPDVDGDIPLLVEVTDDDSAVLAEDASAGTTQDPFQAVPTNGGPEQEDAQLTEGTKQKCFPDAPSSLTSSGVVGMGYSFNQFLFNLTPGGTPAPDANPDIEKHRIDGYHAFVNILRALVDPTKLDQLETDLENLQGKTRMYTIVRDYFIGVHNIMYYTKQDDAKKAYIDFVKQLVKKYKHNGEVEGEEGFNVELSENIKETDIQFMFGIKSRVDPSVGYKSDSGYFKNAYGIYAKNPNESNDLLPTSSSDATHRQEIDVIPRKSLVMDIAVWDPSKKKYVSTAEHEVMGYANPITVLSYTDDGGKLLFETYYNKYTSLRNANPKESHAIHLRKVNESIKKNIDGWLNKLKLDLGLELKNYDKWPEDKRNEYNRLKNLYNLIYVYTEITDNSFWDIRMHPKYANNTSFWPADYNIRGLEVVNDERHMELQPTFMPEEKPIDEVLSDNGIIASPLMINVKKGNRYTDKVYDLEFLSGCAFMICTSDQSYKKKPEQTLQQHAKRMLDAYLKQEKEKNTTPKNPPKFFRYWVIPPAYSLEEYLNYTSERLTLAQSKNTAELANLPPMGSIDTSLHILKVMLDKGIFDNLGITGKNGEWTKDDMEKVRQYITEIYEAYNNKTDSTKRRQLLLDPAHTLAFHCIGKNQIQNTSFHSFTAGAAQHKVPHYKFLNILLNKLLYRQDSVSQKFVLKDGILDQVSSAWNEHVKSNPKHVIRIASKKSAEGVKNHIKLVHTQTPPTSKDNLQQYLAIKVDSIIKPKSYLMNGKVEMANLYDHDEYTLLGDMLQYMTECHIRSKGEKNKYSDIRNKYNTKYIQKDLFFSKTTPPATETDIDLIQKVLNPLDPFGEIKGDTKEELCKNAATKGLLVYKVKNKYEVRDTKSVPGFQGRTVEWLSDKEFKLKKDDGTECAYKIVQNSKDFKALCVSTQEAENHHIVETVQVQQNSDGTNSVELSEFKKTVKANVEQFIKETIGLNLTEDEIKRYLDLYQRFENQKVFKSPSNISIAIQEFITTYSSELSEDDKDKITKVFTRCGNGAAIIGMDAKLFDSASNEEQENYQGYRRLPLVRFQMLMDIYLNTSVTQGNPSNSGTIETQKLVIPSRVKELWDNRKDTGMTFTIKINNTEYKVKQIDTTANQIEFESGATLKMEGDILKLDLDDVTTIEPINIDNIPTCGTITI